MLTRLLAVVSAGALATLAVGAPAPAQTDGDDAEPSIPTPAVEILDPGEEPRAPLRFALTAGMSVTATQSVDQYIRQVDEEGFGNSDRVPTIDLGLRLDVQTVGPDGTAQVLIAFTSVDATGNGSAASADQARAIESALADLTDLTGTSTFTNRGVQVSGSFDVPDDLPDTVKTLLDQYESQLSTVTPPLPEEPVGVGARWRATTELELGGITAQQRYDYTVESIEGSHVELRVRLRQTAEPQDFDPPGARKGDEYHLLSLRTTGKGTTTFDATTPVPPSAVVEAHSKQRLRFEERGKDAETIDVTIDQEQRISSP
jgi:hypothetical protein